MNTRVVLLTLLGAVALGMLVAPAFAEDPAEAPGKAAKDGAGAPAGDPLSHGALDDVLKGGSPVAYWLMLISKWGGMIVGLVLLVRLYLRYDRIRAGVLPAPEPNPPPALFDPGVTLLLIVAAFAIMPILLSMVVAQAMGIEPQDVARNTVATILVAGLSSLPIAAIVVLRRYRLTGDRVPGAGRALGSGIWAFFVATALVVPVTILTVLVMTLLGHAPEVQALVRETVTSPDPAIPISIATYGILLAPFVEECIFRALLYPSLKRWLGDTRRAAILSAVAVSLVFAAIHGSWTAGPGLFVLALVLTYVYERTNSLAAVVVAHAVNNALALIPLLILRFS